MSTPEVSPELPSAGWRATLALLGRLPQAGLSRSLGRLADIPVPRRLRPTVYRRFARAVGADLAEVERPLEEYGSVNEFFVRRLKPGLRRWPADPDAVGSPVDGIVGAVGPIERGTAIQAKGRRYSVAQLLGSADGARTYEGGWLLTLYLSPRHYHRVHAPVGGTIAHARHVPGTLLPVNAPSVAHVPDLFARNERVLCTIDSPLGPVAAIAVGAYNVARISTAFDPSWSGERAWVSNRRDRVEAERTYRPPLRIERGAELMAFHLGSTVILLFERGRIELDEACRPGREVRLGETLAHAVRPNDLSAPSGRAGAARDL
jgi:phosphatidylserine decarboxylase